MTRDFEQRYVLRAWAIELALVIAFAFVLSAAPGPSIVDDDSLASIGYPSAWARRNGDRNRDGPGSGGGQHGDSDHESDRDGRGGDDDSADADPGDSSKGGDSAGDDSSDSNGGGKGSGNKGKHGKGKHGGSDDSDSDSDSDSGDQPGNSDSKGKSDTKGNKDKSKTNNGQNSDQDDTAPDQPAKDKSVAAKDKSTKKDKKPAKPAEEPPVETPAVPASDVGGPEHSVDHKGGQVVGVGMSSADMAAVSAMGFSVATPAVTTMTPVVEIMVPTNIDEEEARAALAKAFPGRRFGLNKLYGGYSTATSNKSSTASKSIGGPPGADPRCVGDQCYGRVMIGWQSGLETCSAGTPIGMIDTGIDVDHPAFAGGSIVARSFSPADVKEEVHVHATGVAALIIGNGRDSSPGLLPKARLLAADVFYVDGDKHVVTDTASLLRALDWLDQAGVGIINMSFSGPEDELVARAIKRMSDKGVVFVAAAGNNGPGAEPAYPAAYPEVVAVTAVDSRMKGYIKANHGSYIDVAAPGVRIWTATASGRSGYQSGTSFAVPFVTAALAAGSVYGDSTAAENWLKSAELDDIGEPGSDTVFGRGLLKAPAGCGTPASSGDLLSAFMTAPATADATSSILSPKSR